MNKKGRKGEERREKGMGRKRARYRTNMRRKSRNGRKKA